MSVRQEVARRDEQRAQAPATVSIADTVKDIINRQANALSAVLPEHLEIDRYSRLTLTAIKANPGLMAAFRTEQGQLSVLLSVMQAAGLGLEPNTPTGECWLQPRKNSGVDECELSIGYKGYAKLARRSGTIRELVAGVVREGDDFSWARGLDHDEFHHRSLSDEGDELTHAYCIARLTNGGTAFTVLTRKQVEKRRAVSESWKNERARPYSPWTKWPEEQWRKTAIRNLLTHGEVDLSPELIRAATSDETPLQVGDDGTIDALVLQPPNELEPPSTPPGAAADDGDRQEPASPKSQGEEEPADTDSSGEGDSPASDGTVDPGTWTGDEWRAQLGAHKRKVADAIREAQRLAEIAGVDKPAELDNIQANADIAVGLYTWMTTK